MKTKNFTHNFMNNFKFVVLLVTILGSSSLFAQVYNVNFAPLNFSANNQTLITNYLGSSSPTPNTAAGSRTLYKNIITINSGSSVVIDCIVTNMDGAVVFDADWRTNTSVAPGNTTDARRVDSMFSPDVVSSNTANFKDFRFEFGIAKTSGSSITSFQPVILDNFVLNVYDVDRESGSQGYERDRVLISRSSYQTFEALSTLIGYNNTSPSILDFYQQGNATINDNTNYSTITMNDHRYRFIMSNVSSFDISLGNEGKTSGSWSSQQQFFLAFSRGTAFTSVVVENNIILDLNANVASVNNEVIVSNNNPYNFTVGTPNVETTNTTLTGFTISYPSANIKNGSDERMIINATGGSVSLDLSSPSGTTFSLSGLSYSMTTALSGGVNTFTFTRVGGGTLTLAQGEALLDALQYQNLSIVGDEVGFRNFTVIALGTYSLSGTSYNTSSPPAIFIANIANPLPVNVISFTGKALENANQLNWTVAQEVDFSHYEVLRSDDGRAFNAVGTVFATENNMDMKFYSFVDASAKSELSYYKLKLVDNNGSVAYTSLVVINRNAIVPTVSNLFPNPATTQVNIEVQGVSVDNFNVSVQDINGKIVYQTNQVSALSNVYQMDVTNLNRGVYIIRIQDEMGNISVSRFAVSK
jgi:hypothetical protein